MKPFLLTVFLLVAILGQPIRMFAFETDQYNLPPTPLADIGDEVAEYAEENLLKAIAKINAEIVRLNECRQTENGCDPVPSAKKRLAYLRSEEAVARGLYDLVGSGFIASTKAGSWMDSHRFRGQPARYKTNFSRSIFIYLPSNYFTISPTVKMFGHSFGTDKIAHLFQQGYTYYRIYHRATAAGIPEDAAVKKAVDWGRKTEFTYYGTLVSGVFSNADLAANYAGMQFYLGLAKPVTVGGRLHPAAVVLADGRWKMNPDPAARKELLSPFISDHLNEALNPSLYIPGLRSAIRGIVRKQSCGGWKAAYPTMDGDHFEALTNSLALWHGADYGHKASKKFVTIASTCFDTTSKPPAS